jgi:hypothetical protein
VVLEGGPLTDQRTKITDGEKLVGLETCFHHGVSGHEGDKENRQSGRRERRIGQGGG